MSSSSGVSRELVKEGQAPSYAMQVLNGTGKGVGNLLGSFSPWEWASRFKAVWQILRGTADESIPSQPFRPVELTAEVVTTFVLHYLVALGIFKAGTKVRDEMVKAQSTSSLPQSLNIQVTELPQPSNIPKPKMPVVSLPPKPEVSAVSLPPMPNRDTIASESFPDMTAKIHDVHVNFAQLAPGKASKLSASKITAFKKALHHLETHGPTAEIRATATKAIAHFDSARHHSGSYSDWDKYTERLKGSLISLRDQFTDSAYSTALARYNLVKEAAEKAAQQTFKIAFENYNAATGAVQETYTAATGAVQETYTAATGAVQETYTAAMGAVQEAADQLLLEYLRRVATIFSISVTGLSLAGRGHIFAGIERRMVDAPHPEVEPDADTSESLALPSDPLVLSRSERRSNVEIHKMLEQRGYFRTSAQVDASLLDARDLNRDEYQTKYGDLFYYVS